MQKKKILAGVLAAAMAMTTLAGCGAGASLARPRLARLRRGVSRCASRGARQPPGDSTSGLLSARPPGGVRPPPCASALRAALRKTPGVLWRGGGRVPPAAPRLRPPRTLRASALPGFARAPCLFGAAARPASPGLPCGLRRPEKAA